MKTPEYLIRIILSLSGLFALLIVTGLIQTLAGCDWKENPDTALTTDLSLPTDEHGNPLYPLDYPHELASDDKDDSSFQLFTQYGTTTIQER